MLMTIWSWQYVNKNELKYLLEQDKFGDFKSEANWLKQDQTANQAYSLVKKQRAKSDKRSVASSRRSRSSSHRSHKSSLSTRLNALAEAAAARESAEYERIMARKEHDCRQRELDHAQEMAILYADKKVAIANAKLNAIEKALQEVKKMTTQRRLAYLKFHKKELSGGLISG